MHPHALRLLERFNYKIGDYRSKSWDEFAQAGAPPLDFVFTVCDNAAGEVCPIWPGQPMSAHWGVPDPAAVEGTDAERWAAFREAFRVIENRIKIFTSLPLDKAFNLRSGTDATVMAWGALVHESLAAAIELANEGISVEVIDVATLKPLDMETILASVAKTGRCVIVHEAPLTAGFGAEIAARLAEEGLSSLLAPIVRVAGYDTVMPLPRLEHHYLPDTRRIAAAVRRVLAYR